MKSKSLVALVRSAVIAGNILFVLWGTFNAVKEHFSGTLPEKISFFGLICLLALNSYFILSAPKEKTKI